MTFWQKLNPYGQIAELKKQLQIVQDGLIRTHSEDPTNSGNEVFPRWQWGFAEMEQLAKDSDIFRSIHLKLKQEVFRNGINLSEAEKHDSDQNQAVEFSDTKGDDELKKNTLLFFARVNENGQSLIQVCKELEDDHNIFDDGWMQFMLNYEFSPDGLFIRETDNLDQDMVKYELKQIKRVHPALMGLVINTHDQPGFNDNGDELMTCAVHRNQLVQKNPFSTDIARCPECRRECRRAYFVHSFNGKKTYFFKEEFEHQKKYTEGKRLGYPPVMTLWMKARMLLYKDKYIMDAYVKQRNPRQILTFFTSNLDSLQKAWENMLARMRDNPHMPGVLAIPRKSMDKSKGTAELLNLQNTLEEMQYVDIYNMMRRDVGAFYGVTPIFQSDMEGSGGLNKEGMQLTVTNRATELGQSLYNNHYFPAIMERLHITSLIASLHPAEQQDEMQKMERLQKSLEVGKLAVELGLEAEYDEDQQQIIIKEGPLQKPASPLDSFGAPGAVDEEQDNQGEPAAEDDMSGESEPVEKTATKKKVNKGLKSLVNKANPSSSLSRAIKTEITKFFKRYKRQPTEKELSEAIVQSHAQLKQEIERLTLSRFRDIYSYEQKEMEKELRVKLAFKLQDANAVSVLANQQVLQESFEGLSDKVSKEIQQVIQDAYRTGQLDTADMEKKIQEIADVAQGRAENIVRTESSKVQSAARLNSYKEVLDFDNELFEHIGPDDHRTTGTSRRIVARTRGGVPWAEYVRIVTEESSKDFPTWKVDPSFPVSHWQSRHTFRRVVKN